MNKKILGVSILITGIFGVGMVTSSVIAQTKNQVTPRISYPIAELGSCADKAGCKIYCDKSENMNACLSFAQKNNLMSNDEINIAKNFKKTEMSGPGGCKGKNECNTYCSGPDNMSECVAFAEKNGLMSGKKLEGAKKVKGAISKGIKPPACGGKEACDAYCSSSEHVEECVKFGESAGIIGKEDAEKIRNKGNKKGPNEQNPEGQQGQGGSGNKGSKGQKGQGQNQKGQKGQGGSGNKGSGGGNGGGNGGGSRP